MTRKPNSPRGAEYLNLEMDGKRGTPEAVAQVLRGVAETLEKSPSAYRYDFELTVDEHTEETDE